MKNKTKGKRRRIKISVFLCCVVVLIAFGQKVLDSEGGFIAADCISRISTHEIDKLETIPRLGVKTVSVNEFAAYENVTVDESLLLVNEKNSLKDTYKPQLVYHEARKVEINTCVSAAFDSLAHALMEKTGDTLFISSAYRDFEKQKQIKQEEGDTAQLPGCSEHQTGLAVDVFVKNYAGSGFLKSESGRFVNENCGDYGFIIRYPIFGEKSTGIGYEPWHLRYVGLPHSKIISNSKITLEEYISNLEEGKLYKYENYVITRQNTENIFVLKSFESAVMSEDNAGGVIITFKTE